MAYRLKTVKYQNSSRKILLQNENGPCPLLACANALLLRGVITLPSACVRNGVASIDDVVNVLADRALKRAAEQTEAAKHASEWKEVSAKKKQPDDAESKEILSEIHDGLSHEHHIHELLSLFPNLQYGMDVNPRFTQGPSGVEYTNSIAAFDLLGVELVHGWLLDPQDTETFDIVKNKSYNELIEIVIHGTEAESELEKLSKLISQKEKMISDFQIGSGRLPRGEEKVSDDSEWVEVSEVGGSGNSVSAAAAKEEDQSHEKATEKSSSEDVPALQVECDALAGSEPVQSLPDVSAVDITAVQKELDGLRDEFQKKSALTSHGSIVNTFLTSTGHQLTYHGLHELHRHVAEECLCVFFRNNHFATMTKHDGVLYLLATDLGYANVSEVVWEKLDSINGDTELFDEFFVRPKPRETLTAADGPALSPEALLAQRGRSEADHQLALQLSKSNGGRTKTQAEMDEEEGQLIAAATEASLKEWNGNGGIDEKKAGLAQRRTEGDSKQKSTISPVDVDREMALALHAQMNEDHDSSERLARQLQEEEDRRAAEANQQGRVTNGRPIAAMAPDRTTQTSGVGSSCVIS